MDDRTPDDDWQEEARRAGWASPEDLPPPGGGAGAPPAEPAVPEWMREAQAAGWSPGPAPAPPPAPPPTGAPPASRDGVPRWLAVLLAAGAALLIVAGGLTAILLLAGGGDEPAVDRSPLSLTAATTRPSPTTITRTTRPASGSRSGLVPHDAGSFVAARPAGWKTEADAEPHGEYFETRWRSRNDPNTSVTIDWTPGTTGTARSNAAGVRAQTNVDRELRFANTNLAGQPAAQWVFDKGADRRVDFFVNACGTGYAILGSTSIGDYAKYRGLFRRVARSVAENAGHCR